MENNQQFLQYLNIAREKPAHFISLIETQINSFVNQKEIPLAEGILYETNEGINAWIEAKNFLLEQKYLPPLLKHLGLCRSSEQHLIDLCQNSIFGHRGSDGSSFSERILRHCKKGPGAMAEIIGADFNIEGRNNAEMTILSLIIDDGVQDRGHRKTIFSNNYKYIGWSSGKQAQKMLTVFNMTENNLENYFQSDQNSFGGFHQHTNSIKTTKRNSQPEMPQTFANDITNNTFSTLRSKEKDNGFSMSMSGSSTGFGGRKGKKVAQKIQNSKTFFQEGCKVIETTTKLIYNDGSIEENVDRRTIYIDE